MGSHVCEMTWTAASARHRKVGNRGFRENVGQRAAGRGGCHAQLGVERVAYLYRGVLGMGLPWLNDVQRQVHLAPELNYAPVAVGHRYSLGVNRAAGPEGGAAVQDRQRSTAGVGLCCRSGTGP